MKLNHFALREGKIVYVPDVPEIPKRPIGCFDYVEIDKRNYQLDLQSAIASGIEVENQNECKFAILKPKEAEIRAASLTIYDCNLIANTIYPLQCRVEIKREWDHSKPMEHAQIMPLKARVTFEQPEKRHAKSEELFDKFLNNTSQEEIDRLVGVEPEAAGQEQEKKPVNMETVKTYRKKPVDVKAIKWTGNNLRDVIDFTGLHESADKWSWQEYENVVECEGLKIFTREGPLKASIGDYIVQGYAESLGYHFWPVKPDYFEQSYFELTDFSTTRKP